MRRFLPKSLRGQFIVLLLAMLALSQFITIMIFSDERQQAVRTANYTAVLERTAALVEVLNEIEQTERPAILRAAASRGLRYWITLPNPNPAVVEGRLSRRMTRTLNRLVEDDAAGKARVYVLEVDRTAFQNQLPGPPERRPPGDRPGERPGPRPGSESLPFDTGPIGESRPRFLVMLAAVPLEDGRQLNVRFATIFPRHGPPVAFFVSIALMALGIVAVVVLMARRITRPMDDLARAADALGRGQPVTDLPLTGPDDIRRTTAAFNAMQERLTRFITDRTRLLAAVSHDLRTPITSLRLQAELIDEDEARTKMIRTLDEMQQLTEATLAFVKEEAVSEKSEQVDLGALLESVSDDLAEMGMDVTCAETPRLPYPCRAQGLKRALRNLIENAVRYGDRARLSIEGSAADGVKIQVEDDGPGIPPDKLEQVFEPFVRLESSRSRETGGVGLGLAITRSIIRAHGGELTLENRMEGGLRAVIELPPVGAHH